MAKPAALTPNPNPEHKNSSVFRIGDDRPRLLQTFRETTTSDRSLKAVVFFSAAQVRATGLEVEASEPPPAHANIEKWPWLDDPDVQKARQMELAGRIVSGATVWRVDAGES
jgi:hypothetical protein